jgi:hypothetical protein
MIFDKNLAINSLYDSIRWTDNSMGKQHNKNGLATLLIKRINIGFLQVPRIYIDDKEVGTLKIINRFKKWTCQLQAGEYSVYVQINNRKSKVISFDISSGEKIVLIAGFYIFPTVASLLNIRPSLRLQKSWLSLNSASKEIQTTSIHSEPSNHVKNDSIAIDVRFEPEHEKIQATIEDVNVPNGVTITVKRSRTVEHTLEIEQSALQARQVKIGFEKILGVSIRDKITKKSGKSYRESETIEYEVILNGEKNEHYRLIWIDIWQNGVAEFCENNEIHTVPFRFRKQTELHVIATICDL